MFRGSSFGFLGDMLDGIIVDIFGAFLDVFLGDNIKSRVMYIINPIKFQYVTIQINLSRDYTIRDLKHCLFIVFLVNNL